jgi:hypothetical protein
MLRRPRLSTGGIAYHVLNRRVGRLELFEKPADYSAFEKILAEAITPYRHVHRGLLFDAEPLASFAVAAFRRRAVRGHAVDHGDAHRRA